MSGDGFCIPSGYVKKEVLRRLKDRIVSFEKLFEHYPEMMTKRNKKRLMDLERFYELVYEAPVCGEDGDDGSEGPYRITQGDEAEMEDVASRIKRGDTAVRRKKERRLSEYQRFMSDCMKGAGDFEESGKLDFNTCVMIWREMKSSSSGGDSSG